MRAGEIREVGRLAGEAVGGVALFAMEMHEGIASRVFKALGPLGVPARFVHDGAVGAVYPTVRRALAAGPRAGAARLALSAPPDALSASSSLPGSLAIAALNGAIGDVLEAGGSELALEMTLRRGGAEHDPATAEDATGRLAVFVHGLCETDDAWRLFAADGVSYGDRLADELGYTPLYARYNTGLHISDNGRRLSELLDQVMASWPVPVEEIALFGHSMGGLVSRSACQQGQDAGAAWVEPLRHVFCLGSPHLGAPLEKAANVAGWALGRLPETRPFAKLLNGRSVGIKDLRFGSCAEADWCDCDPDEFLRDRCQDVPFLETATYYFVGATLSRSENGMLGRVMGDLLVRYPSASGNGRRRRIPFELDNGFHLPGATHFHLLGHPAVYGQLRSWLERGAPAAEPLAAG
jgi:pimeloyl-ACP methyl ester carboxylesterase